MSETTPTTTPAEPAATPSLLAAGAGREWLPTEYQADPSFKDFKDVAGLAKSYKDTSAMLGTDKAMLLRLPTKDDDPAWGEVHAKLGRPEKAEGYELKAPHAAVDAEMLTAFQADAHKAGLTKRQAEAVVGFYGGRLVAMEAAQAAAEDAAFKDGEAKLKGEWGEAYTERMGEARRLLEIAGGPDVVAAVNKAGLGNDVTFLKAMVALSAKVREPDGLRGGATGGMGGALTPADARTAITAKQMDPEFQKAYYTAEHPAHKAAVEEMAGLFRAANPKSAELGWHRAANPERAA